MSTKITVIKKNFKTLYKSVLLAHETLSEKDKEIEKPVLEIYEKLKKEIDKEKPYLPKVRYLFNKIMILTKQIEPKLSIYEN